MPSRPSLGMDLVAGHVHRDRYGRSPAPAASHRPAKGKRKQTASAHELEAHRSSTPTPRVPLRPPRLKMLSALAADIPTGSSSALSSTSPARGSASSQAHPYTVGEALDESSFEMVPSSATRATTTPVQEDSMHITPIRRSSSSPIIQHEPKQVDFSPLASWRPRFFNVRSGEVGLPSDIGEHSNIQIGQIHL